MSSSRHREPRHGEAHPQREVPTPPAAVLAYALAYECPDCVAEKVVGQDAAGMWRLQVRHDDTCPTLAEIEGRR